MTLPDAVAAFLRHCRFERGLSELTLNAYQLDLGQFVARLDTATPPHITEIDKFTIRQYIEWLSANFKPRSIKRKLATLKAFFAFLEQEETIPSSPFRKLRLRLERAKSLPRTIPVTSVSRILGSAYALRAEAGDDFRLYRERTRDIAVLETLFATGVRVSELCSLELGQVDIRNRQILVMGKGKRERVVPLCDAATIKALEEYAACHAEHLEPGRAFFLNRNLRPLSDQSVRHIIKKHQQRSNLPGPITPHMFRHTIATLLLENGVDIRNIQTLLGHSSLAVTEIYTHVSLSAQREVLDKHHPRAGLVVKEGIDN